MSRINTNVPSLLAQRVLTKNKESLNTSLERLSTGLKINTGADNPAGLIASENLRAEKTGITAAISNAERASNIIGTAEGGLSAVSSLLNELQGLVSEAANTGGLSKEELDANQLQVDAILGTVNRLAGSVSFQGMKLLNGNFSYTTSGVTDTEIDNLRVNAARIAEGTEVNVVVDVVSSGATASIGYTGGAIASGGGGVTIEVGGNKGVEQLSFSEGTTVSSIVTAVNGLKAVTGVSAAVSGTAINFASTEFGEDQFVSVSALSGTFTTTAAKDFGTDAVVNVNGAAAEVKGTSVSYRSSNLDVEFDLDSTFNTNGSSGSFNITGGGATFALGSKVTESDKASIGIASVSTGSLGNASTGYLSSLASGGTNAINGDSLTSAQEVVSLAIKQVSELRGRLGAFQKFTIGSTVDALGVALENANAAESSIRDTDFAAETAAMTRNQILTQAATSVLSQANAAPQSALSLLG